jgi:hypothetical protein
MSCPHFYPTESARGSALFPLGDSWTGQCHANRAEPVCPDNALACNLGYARGQCARFPDEASADAVRFTISHHDADGLLVYYVMEGNHLPVAHGPLTYAFAGGFAPMTNKLLERQAAAYVESYLRRKRER